MMDLTLFFLAMLLPWVQGCIIVRLFVGDIARRHMFVIGSGYIVGWFCSVSILRLYSFVGRLFDLKEILFIQLLFMILLFFLLRKNNINVKKHEEKEISFAIFLVFFFLIICLCLRLVEAGVDLMSKPVYPWDGWLSWSAKAKVFFYNKAVSPIYGNYSPFWAEDEIASFVHGARHPYFISLIQTYMALAWGGWDDNIVNLPWLGLYVATVLIVLGALRYLGVESIVALLAGYLVISLPIYDAHISLGSYADVWVAVCFLTLVLLTVMCLNFNEWRLIFLIVFFIAILYSTKHSSLVLLPVILILMSWRFLGGIVTTLLLILSLVALLFLAVCGSNDFFVAISKMLSSSINAIEYNPVGGKVIDQLILLDNWHFVFISVLVCLALLLISGVKSKDKCMILLLVAGLSSFFIMMFLTFFTEKMSLDFFIGYFNRVILYFTPVFSLIPVSIYQILRNRQASIG